MIVAFNKETDNIDAICTNLSKQIPKAVTEVKNNYLLILPVNIYSYFFRFPSHLL